VTRPDTATKHAADVSAMFDEVSPRYDLINDVLTVGNDRLWRIATTRAVAPRKGMRILDLAAGTGTSSAAFAAHGAHVTAADFSEGMLTEGRKRHAGNDLIEFQWADATQLPFADDSFDAATISDGLRNVNDPKAALREMRRVARGPVLVLTFDLDVSARTWLLSEYLPEVDADDRTRFPSVERIAALLGGADVVPVPIPADCADGFFHAFFARPEAYLDPAVRAGRSAWPRLPAGVEERAVAALAEDLRTGVWDERNGAIRRASAYDGGLRLVVA